MMLGPWKVCMCVVDVCQGVGRLGEKVCRKIVEDDEGEKKNEDEENGFYSRLFQRPGQSCLLSKRNIGFHDALTYLVALGWSKNRKDEVMRSFVCIYASSCQITHILSILA